MHSNRNNLDLDSIRNLRLFLFQVDSKFWETQKVGKVGEWIRDEMVQKLGEGVKGEGKKGLLIMNPSNQIRIRSGEGGEVGSLSSHLILFSLPFKYQPESLICLRSPKTTMISLEGFREKRRRNTIETHWKMNRKNSRGKKVLIGFLDFIQRSSYFAKCLPNLFLWLYFVEIQGFSWTLKSDWFESWKFIN